MLEQLLRQSAASLGVFFRTIRAFFARSLMGIRTAVRRITNPSRSAAKAGAALIQEVNSAIKKPTKREDYIETEHLLIAKSFLVFSAAALIAAGLFIYFIAWPFILSHFLTARFYQEDGRILNWTGKVIVYYDSKKRVPMYSGKLTDGMLQGQGQKYDEDGLLTYEGSLVDGTPSGNGTAYQAGVLVYQGQFLNGVYEGFGSLYDDGELVYQGAFAAGQPNGMGTAYKNRIRCYEGAFVDGLYHGEGVAYYEDNGAQKYKGSFADGFYDGSGTVYLKNGDWIRSEFSAGVGGGVIQWYRHGRLWYDGEADDLTPDGFGTIYAASGKAVYAGEMDRGTLDGSWLLTRTAQELREVFEEADLEETFRTGSGFLLINRDLGLTVLCTLRQDEEESYAFRIWLSPGEESDAAVLLPWKDRRAAELWAGASRDTLRDWKRAKGGAFLASGGIGGDWDQSVYYYEDHNSSLVCRRAESAPFQLIWAQPGGLDVVDLNRVDESFVQAQERLDGLLEVLDSLDGGSGESGCSAADPADVERLLALMTTPQDAYSLINALTDYYVYGRVVEALEASQPLLEQNLVEQQRLLERSQGSQSAVDIAQDRLNNLDRQLVQYRVVQEQAKLIGERLTGLKLDGYDLTAVLRVFDVAGIDANALYDKGLAYARDVAAGRYDVDEAQFRVDIKTQVLDLTLAYENVRTGQKSLERMTALLEKLTQDYAVGEADKAALYETRCSLNDTAAALFQSMGAYTRLVNRLNDLSGGWLAEEYDWFGDPFAVIYATAVLQAQAEAEAEKQRPSSFAPELSGDRQGEAEETDGPSEAAGAPD